MNSAFPSGTLHETSGRFSTQHEGSRHIGNSNLLSQLTQVRETTSRIPYIQVFAVYDDHTFPET